MNRFFIRVTWVVCGLLLALPLRGATPEVGKDALRNLVHLPTITFQPNWSFDPERGFTFGSTDEDVTTQINTLREGFKHNNSDAEAFEQLGELYTIIHDADNAVKSSTRAVELYRERLEQQPDDPVILADLGSALRGAGKLPEAESVLRKAVQLAPKDWKCRVALGRLLDAAARQDIYDRPPMASDRPTATEVALAQNRLTEAGDDFDRAVAAAPEEGEVYLRRAFHLCLRASILKQIRVAEGEQPDEVDLADNSFSPEALADLQHASRLAPRNYNRMGSEVLFEIYTVCAHRGHMDWAEFSWNSLPDKSQRSLHDALTRLENLGQDSDAQVASGALEVLGVLQGPVLHESRSCVTTLRRAVALDAAREQGAEILVGTLAQTGRYDELLDFCEDRVKQKDTARNHLLLAKAYEKLKQWDDAEAEALEALRQSPTNLTASLDLAALLLRRSQDSDVLVDANDWLTRAEGLLGQATAAERSQQLVIDLTLLRSIYFALTDNVGRGAAMGAGRAQDRQHEQARA